MTYEEKVAATFLFWKHAIPSKRHGQSVWLQSEITSEFEMRVCHSIRFAVLRV